MKNITLLLCLFSLSLLFFFFLHTGEEHLRELNIPLGIYWNDGIGKTGHEPERDVHNPERTKETVYTV